MTTPPASRSFSAGAVPMKGAGAASGPSAELAGLVLEQGRIIANKYVLERPAGFGGMAQLWVATNQATGAEVCVKLLVPEPGEGGHDDELVARFRREAHAAASLSHRAIVRVFDLLELDEQGAAVSGKTRAPYAYAIVMELLRGETLGDVLAKRGKIPTEEALDLFLPILSALGHAHRASIVHRDLKPDNIFLATEPDGHVIPKVLDFGVSKLGSDSGITTDGVVVGTPSFMSPEQAKGARHIDARSDVFSAGILFYMMLSGRNPFDDAPSFASTVEAVLRREVASIPDLAPEIWSVIERAIQKGPAGRFGDATEMSVALRRASGRRAGTESDPNIVLPPLSSRSTVDQGSGARTHDSTPGSSVVSLPHARPAGARRRQTIVAAVVGAGTAVIMAAVFITLLGPGASGGANGAVRVEPVEAPGPPASVLTASSVAPAASVLPADSAATSSSVAEADSGSIAPGTVKPASVAVQRGAPAVRPAATLRRQGTPVRRPGEEPKKARDPGF